ncbi:MAG: DNA translocase FtsK 4TM domain-containing protein [Gammaproteobacteria bacterium]|nr:DNA translocase FtsK 4TM domain-containing protein [Gammaproteobacteria bacterium]
MMKQNRSRESRLPASPSSQRLIKHMIEGGFILVLSLAVFVLFSLLTYQVGDIVGNGASAAVMNAGGQVGAWIATTFYSLFGYFSYFIPVFIFYFAGSLLLEHRAFREIHQATMWLRGVGLILFVLGGCGLVSVQISPHPELGVRFAGGIIGQILAFYLIKALNIQGAILTLGALLMVGLSWVTGLSWLATIEWLGRSTLWAAKRGVAYCVAGYEWASTTIETMIAAKKARQIEQELSAKPLLQSKKAVRKSLKPQLSTVLSALAPGDAAFEQTALAVDATPPIKAKPTVQPVDSDVEALLPPLDLLVSGDIAALTSGYTSEALSTLSRDVEQHLLDFGIQVEVVAVHPGPVITRFELQLAAGVKVSRLSALAKDLARSLSVTSVRIVEIIPGKTVVGIELPNPKRNMVRLADVLSAEVYQHANSLLSLALGVDIAGHPMVVDLAKMPHLLVAGTTGSGKSVGINAMILSLLYKATPEQVRLIMVDPKMLELSVYDGIPHLLTPVVTDMKEASSALRWCVGEMERRYRLMAAVGVRNLAGFNTKVTEANTHGDGILDPLWKITDSIDAEAPKLQPLPYIVVIIDELADMMMVVGKKVEQLIARIAQKARAAGIHLILATQRPSVDVLTGLIKSNIPTRISFQVSSKIDSRTILDQQGAEQLLGHGDMLFLAPGTGTPLRVHGAFVDDQEVHRVADDWRARGTPDYIDAITETQGDFADGDFGEERQATEEADALYDEAVAFVMQTRKASISSVQRRFKIGYNRAARLVEEMERCGLVGPMEGGFRDVLVNAGAGDE